MAISLDGTASSNQTNTVTITTTKPNDIIICIVTANLAAGQSALTGVSGGGLTWTFRARAAETSVSAQYLIEEWWAQAPSALTSQVITATVPGGSVNAMGVIAINGANYSSPFDTGGAPFVTNGDSLSTPVFSTAAANTVVVVGARGTTSSPSGVTGWTNVLQAFFSSAASNIYTSPQTSTNVPFANSFDYRQANIVDAVVQAATAMQTTQVALEEWARIIPPQMQATQVSAEIWATVALYVPPPFTPAPILVMA